MIYTVYNFQDVVELMASCEQLGVPYIVKKEIQQSERWFGRKVHVQVYRVITTHNLEDGEKTHGEDEVPQRGLGEGQEESDV